MNVQTITEQEVNRQMKIYMKTVAAISNKIADEAVKGFEDKDSFAIKVSKEVADILIPMKKEIVDEVIKTLIALYPPPA